MNPDALSQISEVTRSLFAMWGIFRGGFFREGVFRGSVNTVEPPEIDEALNPDAISRISEVTT